MGDHCYADRDLFWRYLSNSGADEYRADDQLLFSFLRGASRAVDAFCRRTGRHHTMSGFGPRTGINHYDADGGVSLYLADDLLSVTTVEVAPGTGEAYVAWSASDYLLTPYDRTPYRELIVPDGSARSIGTGLKVARVTGTWGYSDERSAALAATVATGGWTDSATTVNVSDATEIAVGQTIWCQSEALLVTDLTGAGLTVRRGAHGTTAASHAQGTALYLQVYDPDVVIATLQIALRRWRHRETGLAGDYGGIGGVPTVSEKARENDILRSVVGHLAFQGRT